MTDDKTLADYLEGILADEQRAELEEQLAGDPELEARLESLRSVFAERVELPAVELPEGLQDAVLDAIAAEGMLGEGLPEGLLGATLDRLESEGLVEPAADQPSASAGAAHVGAGFTPARVTPGEAADAAPAGRVLAFPGLARMAAAALLAAGVAFLAGRATAPEDGAVADLRTQLEARTAERDAQQQRATQLEGERDTLTATQARLERERQDAVAAAERLPDLEAELASAKDALSSERDRADALSAERDQQAELVAARDRQLGERDRQLGERDAQLTERTRERDALQRALDADSGGAALAQAQREARAARKAQREAEAQRDALRTELASLQQQPAAAGDGMLVADAAGLGVWDVDARRMRPLQVGERLERGTIVVSGGGRAALTVGERSVRLPNGLYQVSGARELQPIPDVATAYASLRTSSDETHATRRRGARSARRRDSGVSLGSLFGRITGR